MHIKKSLSLSLLFLSLISSLLYQSDSVVITPSEHPDAQTFINGSLIAKPTTLHHVSYV